MAKLPTVLLRAHDPPFAALDCSGHCSAAPLGPDSPASRYRRPRQCLRLPRTLPLLLRLAARGAMPSQPSLLPTIMEVDESLSTSAAKRVESSSKRRSLSDLWSHIAYQVRAEWRQATVAPDAMEHWHGM